MNKYRVTRFNPNSYPSSETREVDAADINQALMNSGFMLQEIIRAELVIDYTVTEG